MLVLGTVAFAAASCGERDDPLDPHAGHTTGPAAVTIEPGELWGTPIEPPAVVEPFTLTDQDGEAFRFPSDAAGAVVTLLYMGYTHCPDICPDTMAEIGVAMRELPPEVAERVAVVFVTVDPERDDPARLSGWIRQFGEDFVGLTGTRTEIDSVLGSLGYEPGTVTDLGGGEYSVGHPVEYLAIAPDGTVRLTYPWETTYPQLKQDLTTLVEEGWR
jgi:protein SCO1/2